MLMGADGAKRVVVNSVGREIRVLDEDAPTEGKRLQLTIDYDVQKAIEDGFKVAGFNGAAVVLDPANGDVLGFTSVPSYDPNAFAAGIDRATWASLNTDDLKPLQDRAIQGRYSPGSTFKMAVALAGLEEGLITPDFHAHCAGHANFYGHDFKCWKPGGHGSIDLRHAIEQSCDVYFYTVANMVGVDKINKWATLLGLGVKSGIDLPNEVQGLVPSTEWKREKMHEKWYAGETISVGIGQGAVSVTPVSMAVYMATLANGGTRVTPHLLKAVDDGNGWKALPPPPPQSKIDIDPDKLQAIRDGLWMVVNQGGTGGRARIRRLRRLGQDRLRAGDLEHRPHRRRPDHQGPARQRLVRVLRAARPSGSRRAWCFSSTASTAATPRRWRITSSTRFSPRKKGGRCRPRRPTFT